MWRFSENLVIFEIDIFDLCSSFFSGLFVSIGFFLLKAIPLLCTGQLPWRGYEIKKSSWRISSKSWSSPSNHSWCERACFYRKVWHPCIYICYNGPSTPCSDMSLIFTVLIYCIISECSVSSLAWFMSNQETSFVTLGQRVLAYPLK